VHEGRLCRLTPTGELDIATAPILRAVFETVSSAGAAETIVVDLTELSFMDCSGISLLLQLNAGCGPAGQLRIVNASRPVERVLDLAGVRSLLPIISPNEDPLALLPAPV
jgi:anti-anti-sigma factor